MERLDAHRSQDLKAPVGCSLKVGASVADTLAMGAVSGGTDRPRAFRDPMVLDSRLTRLREPHVAPLTDWVEELRRLLGDDAIVPWFDPADGGVAASILWLLEAPSRKATREFGGSGIVSPNNNDGTAANTWRTRDEAGVSRSAVVHWNVIPYYIGTASKIRAWTRTDIAAVGPLLSELLSLLPQIQCVVLGGRAAQTAWHDHRPEDVAALVIECPHPSQTNVNTRPCTWARIVEAWRLAGSFSPSVTSHGHDRGSTDNRGGPSRGRASPTAAKPLHALPRRGGRRAASASGRQGRTSRAWHP